VSLAPVPTRRTVSDKEITSNTTPPPSRCPGMVRVIASRQMLGARSRIPAGRAQFPPRCGLSQHQSKSSLPGWKRWSGYFHPGERHVTGIVLAHGDGIDRLTIVVDRVVRRAR